MNKQFDYFSTIYGSDKLVWIICYADNGIKEDDSYKNRVLIGESGEVHVGEIKEELFIICEPSDGYEQWNKWREKVTDKLKQNGVEERDIKQEIVKILFENVNSYKDNIKEDHKNPTSAMVQKNRRFYFDVEFEEY